MKFNLLIFLKEYVMIKINRKPYLFFLAVGLFVLSSVEAQNKTKSEASLDKKVETLLKKMTLDEKIGQLNQYNGFWDVTGPTPKEGFAAKKYEDRSVRHLDYANQKSYNCKLIQYVYGYNSVNGKI